MNTLYSTTSTDLIADLHAEIRATRALIARLSWDTGFAMLNGAGLIEAIRTLPNTTTYTVVFADIDNMKRVNSLTGSHCQTDRYLAAGLAVRYGEIAGRIHGDEIVFLLDDQARDRETESRAFVARIARQLAGQPLPLSATFATQIGVSAGQVPSIIERLSCEVLLLKAARDENVRVAV